MKNFFLSMMVVCALVPCFAQSQFSGKSQWGGASVFGYVPPASGGPLTYLARIDTCVHGYSTNSPTVAPFYNPAVETCVPGATTGESGSALIFQEGVSDPLPFNRLDAGSNPAVMNTSFVDPDFGSYTVFATDNGAEFPGTLDTTKFIMGSDGAYDAFGLGTANDVLWTFQNNGSVPFFAHLIESRFLAHSCSPSLPCIIPSNVSGSIGCIPSATSYVSPNCTHTQTTTGGISFSRNHADPANTSYEMAFPQVYQDVWTEGFSGGYPTGTDSITRTLKVDFSGNGGGSIPCSIVPTDYVSLWNGQFAISDTGQFSYASGGGGSYQTISQHMGVSASGPGYVVTPDVFIMPVNNQPSLCGGAPCWAFQASSGTTSGTEPNWAADCPALGNTCTDGSVTWTNIGKVNGQGPGFDLFFFDPARGCSYINTRLNKMYRGTNEGALWPASGTADPAGQQLSDDAVTCYRMGGSSCGTGGVVNFTDIVTLHSASTPAQGRYSLMEPTSSNAISSPSYSCLAGSKDWTVFQTWPNSGFISGNSYTNGKYVSSPVDHNYYVLIGSTGVYTTDPSADPTNWTNKADICFGYFIDWYANMVRPNLEIGPDFGADGHGQQGFLLDFHGQSFWTHYLSQPNCQNNTSAGCNGTAVGQGCSVLITGNNYVGAPSPGCKTLPMGLPSDYHPSGRAFGNQDLQPLTFYTTQVPAWGGVSMRGVLGGGTGVGGYCCAGYLETTAVIPGGAQILYRFGHNWCSGSNAAFSIQNCIGVTSQDGLIGVYGSDFMNTRGDAITGSTTCAHPLRGQYGPSTSQTVAYLDYMLPVTNNAAGNIYQAVGFYSGTFPSGSYVASGSGAEGSSIPNWSSATLGVGCPTTGQYCTSDHGDSNSTSESLDGNVLWLNVGPNTCNSSLGMIDLTSAHPAP